MILGKKDRSLRSKREHMGDLGCGGCETLQIVLPGGMNVWDQVLHSKVF